MFTTSCWKPDNGVTFLRLGLVEIINPTSTWNDFSIIFTSTTLTTQVYETFNLENLLIVMGNL